MALLDMLRRHSHGDRAWKLVVAHLDHGIRDDSSEDRRLVRSVAVRHGLPFVYHESRLGQGASEAVAREARYDFLRQVRQASGAGAIITAHHQDDALETAIINILRGSGRKGLTSLSSRADMIRPLLRVPKRDLIAYARDQGLEWREDSTNQDESYLRNYVRHRLLSRFDEAARIRLGQLVEDAAVTNRKIDTLLVKQLRAQPVEGTLDRQWFNHLPHAVAREVLATWLRQHGLRDFDSKTLERLVIAAKVGAAGKTFPIRAGLNMRVRADHLALTRPER